MNVIGSCSCCGGPVTVPDAWGGVVPPTPSCMVCGAVAAHQRPIIDCIKKTPVVPVYIPKIKEVA